MEPGEGQLLDLLIVLFLHEEVGIAPDADIRKMDQRGIAAMTVPKIT